MTDFGGIAHSCCWYVIRHGESAGNRDQAIQGRLDTELTDRGQEQAVAAGARLRDCGIQRIVTSPLKRAYDTAVIVAEAIGSASHDIVVTDDLVEVDTGVFTGKSFAAIERDMPDMWRAFNAHSWQAVDGAERIPQLVTRAQNHWQRLIEWQRAGITRVLTVSHGGTINWLFKSSMQADQRWMPVLRVSNCGVFELVVEPSGLAGGYYAEWRQVNVVPYEV